MWSPCENPNSPPTLFIPCLQPTIHISFFKDIPTDHLQLTAKFQIPCWVFFPSVSINLSHKRIFTGLGLLVATSSATLILDAFYVILLLKNKQSKKLISYQNILKQILECMFFFYYNGTFLEFSFEDFVVNFLLSVFIIILQHNTVKYV